VKALSIISAFIMLSVGSSFAQVIAYNNISSGGTAPAASVVVYRAHSTMASVYLPGERMMKAGKILTIGGGAMLLTGVILMATAEEQYYNTYSTPYGTYEEGDPKYALGLVMAIGGAGMTIPGIILWSKGSKRYKAYQQRESSLEINPANLGLRYRF
jgi:hypothetical protein